MNSDSLFKIARAAGLLALALGALPLRAQPLDLPGAVDAALRRNPRILQFEERLAQKDHEHRAATGNFLPSLRLEGAYTHLDDPLQIDLEPLRQALVQLESGDRVAQAELYGLAQGRPPLTAAQRQAAAAAAAQALDAALPPFTATLKDQDYPSAALTLVQPLFTGGKLVAAHRAAGADVGAARAELARARDEVVQEAVERYLNVVLLRAVVATRREVLAGVEQHLAQARRLEAEGLLPHAGVMRAEVAVAEARLKLSDDESRLSLGGLALRSTLGLPAEAPLDLTDTLAYVPVADSLGALRAAMLGGQPLLHLLAARERGAAQKAAAERAEFFPQLALFGRYELFPGSLSALEPGWAVGVRAQLTLFSGLQRYHRVEAAHHLRHEVEQLEAYTRDQLTLLVERAYRDLRQSEARYHALAADVALAAEHLRLSEKRFETGLGTSLDVIDARLAWEKNQVERLTSLHDYYQSLNRLHTAAGHPQSFLTLWPHKEVSAR